MIRRLRFLVLCAVSGALLLPSQANGSVAAVGFNFHWQLGAGYHDNLETFPVTTLVPPEVKEVAAADGFSMALLDNGTALEWGGDVYGQCGCGGPHRVAFTSPMAVHVANVVQIGATGAHAIALTASGQVYSWGSNLYGTVGNGQTTKSREVPGDYVSTPFLVPLPLPAKYVYAGGPNSYAVLIDGTVMAWGENKDGQVGDGTTVEKPSPVKVKGLSDVRYVVSGGIGSAGGHALAQLSSGAVVGWGTNSKGQLGTGATSAHSATPVPVHIDGSKVQGLSAGVAHNLALMTDGTVEAWGSNSNGQLGAPTTQTCTKEATPCSTTPIQVRGLSNATAVSAGFRFSLAASGGLAFGWGWNDVGQLGIGTRIDSSLPSQVQGIGGVTAVSAGQHHSLFLLSGAGPVPVLSATVGSGAVALAWRSNSTAERWTLSWRVVAKPANPWGKFVLLPPASRSYTVTGLTPGTLYEFLVKNVSFGSRKVQAAPK